jgi:hypothetical protein
MSRLCDYCGDNEVDSGRKYCGGWCEYQDTVRSPMKRNTMHNMIDNWERVMGYKLGESAPTRTSTESAKPAPAPGPNQISKSAR